MELISIIIPFFFLLSIALEAAYNYWQQQNRLNNRSFYRLNDSLNDLSMGIVSQICSFSARCCPGIYWNVYQHFHIFDLSSNDFFTGFLPSLQLIFPTTFFIDFSHERNILWATHVPHHQSEEFNFSIAFPTRSH